MTPGNMFWNLPIPARPVQLEALNKGFGLPGFAYFVRQRLGKTYIAFAEFSTLRNKGEVDWMFIICPNSLKEQWRNAIEQVDPYIPIFVYSASKKNKVAPFFKTCKKGGVFIINYESLAVFLRNEQQRKLDPGRIYIIADESTKIKDPYTSQSKAARAMSLQCKYRRILTGKPTPNSNADMWAQLKFIGATTRNFDQHRYFFCATGGYKNRQILRNLNTKILQEEIQPVSYTAPDKYVRAFRKEYEPLRKVELLPEQRKQYREMQNKLVTEINNGIKITASVALSKYLRLQQISSGVAGDPDHVQHNAIPPSQNPRIKLVLDLIEDEVGIPKVGSGVPATNKVIIAARFRLSIENLKGELERHGYRVTTLVGGLSGDELEARKKAFNDGDTHILIGQLQVLAYGHTLYGNKDCPTDSVIFYENDFSLEKRNQCESRPENDDWHHPISYYDMYASDMDHYILTALLAKEDAANALLGYASMQKMKI